MDSEVVRSFSPARDERWRKKLQRGQKKATPQFGSENWQKLRLPTSQVYTLENANSNFLSKPTHYSFIVKGTAYKSYDLVILGVTSHD